MATPKSTSKAATPAKNLSEKQLRRIWTDLKPTVLLERLRAAQPSHRWNAAGNRMSACCPFHSETTPSFHVYLDRGYAKCYGCEAFISNPIMFWAKVKGLGLSEALTDLKQQFGLKFLSASANSQLAAWERNQLVKKRVMAICHDELINAINAPTHVDYAAAQPAVDYLLNTRKIPVDAIPTLHMLGIMPPIARVLERLRVEAEQENAKREKDAAREGERADKFTSLEQEARDYILKAAGWIGALIFRLDVAPDAIGRLKLRRPETKDFLMLADEYEDELGFFGLGWTMYKGLLGANQKYAPGFYLVEGEFDALSVMARQVQAGGPGFVILSGGGSAGGAQIDSCKNFGFDEVYLMGDAPNKKGDELIEGWLPHIKLLRSKVFIGYDQFPAASDPDDAVVGVGLDAFQKVILDTKVKTVFQTPQEWVFDKAQPLLEPIDAADLRRRIEIAGDWGRLLKNNVECDAYVDLCHKAYGLTPTLLKREIVAREEDEPAFVLRVVSVLQQIFYVIGQRAMDNDRRLYLWHKEQEKIVQVALADDGSVERELGSVLGTNFQLFTEKIGVPSFLEPHQNKLDKNQFMQELDKGYRFYLRQALIVMAQGVPDFDTARHMGQGIHVMRGISGEKPQIYLVNGRKVYHGTYVNDVVSWRALEGPSNNGIVFDVGIRHPEAPWLEFVKTAEDLTRANTLNAVNLHTQLHHILDIGWRYKNHAVTTDFLAAHLMAATICSAFRRQVMVAFHADTRAGKSKMVMGLIAGTDFSRAHLIAAAVGIPAFTAAGIRQTMNNKTRPLCLDEFEDDGSAEKKSRTITETLEMFRSLVGEDNRITQGTRGGEPLVYRLNFFVFIASITKARKSQDANRMITIYMERMDNKLDPVQELMQSIGSTALEELKKDLAIALLPHIAEIQTVYDDIETEYGKAGAKPAHVDSRMFEALYPALSIMKILKLDYHAFVTAFCEANKEAFTTAATHTDSMALFDWLTQSPKLYTRSNNTDRDRNAATILQLLMTPETRAEINQTGSGVFYDEASEILIVNWTTAIQEILRDNVRYARETNVFNLRELANRAPHALKPEDLARSPALARMRVFGLKGVSVGYLTGYRMSHILQDVGPTDTTAPTKAAEPVTATPTIINEVQVDDGSFDA